MSGPSFGYVRATELDDAVAAGARPGATYLAGGTDLLPLWKAGLAAPQHVIDISRLSLADIFLDGSTLVLGALARLSDVAAHPDVKTRHPLVCEAILASASGQVRNLATIGGNLLQRTRCPYFRDRDLACNKHDPGSGCGARHGENRHAALFGASAGCVATHASDLAVALAALDTEIEVTNAVGERRLALQELYPLPSATTAPDSSLAAGDIITAIRLSDMSRFAPRSTYLKIRDRASFEFAVVSVAAALRIEDGVIAEARLAAGGVAPLPWRLRPSEAALVGRAPTEQAFVAAAELAIEGASPLEKNAFKIPLLRNAVIRALETVGGLS
ncbi:FAD binding domain-containing protein [Bradyrhizobium sp. GCM10027634]|uniref:FAD binding domain-containing protein n=1 Tax=unclassified Bradyrhizobium TaxID=2631580 RepID=UPI001889ECBC|nr:MULTISPECIES: xanthine dehydrogenase family protein subunit M [unclassified Bradyrhizobium]MDN5004333.1 xanthine dehydrogenase family protein subunit M [Bradyrhizobium sp. WYCCWR 12677]QOZ46998.1 xanthine dehydrogenase family protein subunit M [Bradyrhizobium sp. CCBAU 53340]